MKKLFAMALIALFTASTSSLVLAADVAGSANAATGKTTTANTSATLPRERPLPARPQRPLLR